MRSLMILALIGLSSADVSELSGYKYHAPGTLDGFGDLGAGSSLGSLGTFGNIGGSTSGLRATSGLGSGFVGSQSEAVPATVSKRFFTFTAEDTNDDDDDDDEYARSAGNKHYDVVFAHAPTPSLKSVLKAFGRYAADQQTAVYVFSKQLGAKEIGDAIRASGIRPNKPHVHFVKYRTPAEAEHAQQQIRARYNGLGGTTLDGGHESAPVRSVIGSLRRRPGYDAYGLSRGVARGPYRKQGGYGGRYGGNTRNYGLGSSSNAFGTRYLPPRY